MSRCWGTARAPRITERLRICDQAPDTARCLALLLLAAAGAVPTAADGSAVILAAGAVAGNTCLAQPIDFGGSSFSFQASASLLTAAAVASGCLKVSRIFTAGECSTAQTTQGYGCRGGSMRLPTCSGSGCASSRAYPVADPANFCNNVFWANSRTSSNFPSIDPTTGRFAEGTRCSSTQYAWLLMQNNCSQAAPFGLRVQVARYSHSQCPYPPPDSGFRLPTFARIILGVGCALLACTLLAAALRRLQRRRAAAAVALTPLGAPPPGMPPSGPPPAGNPYAPTASQAGYAYAPPQPYPAAAAWPPAPPGQQPPPPPGQGSSYYPSPGGHSPAAPPLPAHCPPPLYTATVGAPAAPAIGSPVASSAPAPGLAPSGGGSYSSGGGAPDEGPYPKV